MIYHDLSYGIFWRWISSNCFWQKQCHPQFALSLCRFVTLFQFHAEMPQPRDMPSKQLDGATRWGSGECSSLKPVCCAWVQVQPPKVSASDILGGKNTVAAIPVPQFGVESGFQSVTSIARHSGEQSFVTAPLLFGPQDLSMMR